MKAAKVLDGISPSPLVVASLRHAPRGKALELGAGSGRNSLFLAHNDYHVTALDNTQSGLEVAAYAAKVSGVELVPVIAELETYNPTERFDLVVATLTLHLFDASSVEHTIRRIQELTATGGVNTIILAVDKDVAPERIHELVVDVLEPMYAAWAILDEEEQPAQDFNLDQRQYHRAGLIARKG